MYDLSVLVVVSAVHFFLSNVALFTVDGFFREGLSGEDKQQLI